ncbi:universal stress protein [Leuconostocaceae bacterium ESL0723]|nr:universal stress protein [Leuconostocaceae bacterium ESL0723]
MSELSLDIEPKQFKNILVGVDESEQGYYALVNAVHQAREDKAELTIVTVLEMGDLSTIQALNLDAINEIQEKLEKNLAKYKRFAQEQGITHVETVFAQGAKFGETLLQQVAPQVNADLLVVGAHSHDGFWDSLGSQAAYVARNAKISALIVRA